MSGNSRRYIQNFVLSESPAVSDELLKSGKVIDINARYYYNENEEDSLSSSLLEGGGDDPYMDEATKLLRKADYQQAIHMSALYDTRLDNLRYLLTCQPFIDIDAQDSEGFTAIRYAVSNNNFRALKLLLDFEADRGICNSSGHTPLEDAEIRGKRECVNLLRNYFPVKEDLLSLQLETKLYIDKLLNHNRFNQGEIDVAASAIKERLADSNFTSLSASMKAPKKPEYVKVETERLRLEAERNYLKEERIRWAKEKQALKDERVRWEFERVKLEIEREAWEAERERWDSARALSGRPSSSQFMASAHSENRERIRPHSLGDGSKDSA